MKIKNHIKFALFAFIFATATSLHAQVTISNTNNIDWTNPQNDEVNTGYNLGTDPYDVLGLTITVATGSQLNLDSISLYLGYGSGGDLSGNAPSPYMEITDTDGDNLGTTPSVTLGTPYSGFYNISSQADAAPYWETFSFSSPVSLTSGTYNFDMWDTGQQLMYFYGGEVESSGVSIVDNASGDDTTPAFAIDGDITTVPEPSAFVLAALGAGAMGIAVLRRRFSKTIKTDIQCR